MDPNFVVRVWIEITDKFTKLWIYLLVQDEIVLFNRHPWK